MICNCSINLLSRVNDTSSCKPLGLFIFLGFHRKNSPPPQKKNKTKPTNYKTKKKIIIAVQDDKLKGYGLNRNLSLSSNSKLSCFINWKPENLVLEFFLGDISQIL
jgi:hypothetical protein